jgi:ferric-dicitrate binding protein FerR (iron transport regulator)
MTCDEAQKLINARIDGEISASDAERLREHMACCKLCQDECRDIAATHGMLQSVLASHSTAATRVADRAVTQLHGAARNRRRLPWWSLIPAMAAGFAIAWFVLRPAENKSPLVLTTTQTIGHLAVASGPVECRRPIDQAWFPLPQGAKLVPGTQLRTGGGVRCEVELAHNSTVRLNENTEITLLSSRHFDLKSGRAWSSMEQAAPEPFQASAASVIFTVEDSQHDPQGTYASVPALLAPVRFDLQAQPNRAKLTVLEGSVTANTGSSQTTINSGQQLLCPDGHLDRPKPIDDLASATSWGLGDHSVLPLIRYIESERSAGQEFKRAEAAQIVADVATPRNIPELLGLLGDENGDVRAAAAAALQRLTGQTLGRTPQKWHDDSLFLCQPSQQAWQHWWQLNHDNFPGAATQPTVVVKKSEPLKKG